MFRAVVVLLSVVFLVDAKVYPGQYRRHHGEQHHGGGHHGGGPQGGGQGGDSCENAITPCQMQLMMQYMPVIQAGGGSPEATQQAILDAITPESIQTHCTNFQSALQCLKTALSSSACSGIYQQIYLPKLASVERILDFTCQPNNVRTISANLACYKDNTFINSLVQTCPNQIQPAMMAAFPNGPQGCRAFNAKLRSLILDCLGSQLNAAHACSSAKHNGGTQLALTLAGKVFDLYMEEAGGSCPDETRELMSHHKKAFDDLYNYQF